VRVEVGELGVSSNTLVTLTLRAESLGWLTNTVSVAATEGDANPATTRRWPWRRRASRRTWG